MTRRGRQPDGRTYGLKPDELRAEIRRLRAEGWQAWEIRQRFDLDALTTAERNQDQEV